MFIKRKTETKGLELFVSGKKVLNKFTYNLKLGIQEYQNYIKGVRESSNFLPYQFSLKYENKLDAVTLNGARTRKPTDLLFATQFIDTENRLIEGDEESFFNQSNYENIGLVYSHNNFFNMFSYGASLTFEENNNFINYSYSFFTPGNLPTYQLYFSPEDRNMLIGINGSKQFLKNKYPTIASVDLKTGRRNFYNSQNSEILYLEKNKIYELNFKIESVSSFPINIELNSKNKWLQSDYFLYPTVFYNQNNISLKYEDKNKNQLLKFSFIYDNNILGDTYTRRNLNLTYRYKLNENLFISLDAVNFDDFFKIFDNTSYYSVYNNTQGINLVKTINSAMHYIILKLNYKL